MFRFLLTLAVLSTIVHAQDVRQAPVTADDVLLLFDNSLAVEISIPEGATGFTLSFGSTEMPAALSAFLRAGTEALRVVVFLPNPSTVSLCPAGETEVTVLIIEISDDDHPHHRQTTCVVHPDTNDIAGPLRYVVESTAPELNEWRPLVVHSWLISVGQDDGGGIIPAVSADHLTSVQVHFRDGNSTSLPVEPEVQKGELLALPSLRQAIERYGLSAPSP